MAWLRFIFGFIIATLISALAERSEISRYFGNDDLFEDAAVALEDEPIRIARNRNSQFLRNQGGVRFGWQNPILVAPTLPPLFGQQGNNQSPWVRPWNPNAPPTLSPFYPNPTQRYLPQAAPTPYYPTYSTTPKRFLSRPTPTPHYGNPTPQPPRNDFSEFESLPDTSAQTQERPRICPPGTRRGRRNGMCYRLGTTDTVCNENMAFYADPTSQEFGQCDCLQNVNRPLVYHRETDKCYFVFQQAYCPPGEWLVIDPERGIPICDINRCTGWTQNRTSNWNWRDNGAHLDTTGTVALLRERSCAFLGWPCSQEGRGQVRHLLLEDASLQQQGSASQIRLTFSGRDLVCSREYERSEFQGSSPADLEIGCKTELINKWRLDGRCNN